MGIFGCWIKFNPLLLSRSKNVGKYYKTQWNNPPKLTSWPKFFTQSLFMVYVPVQRHETSRAEKFQKGKLWKFLLKMDLNINLCWNNYWGCLWWIVKTINIHLGFTPRHITSLLGWNNSVGLEHYKHLIAILSLEHRWVKTQYPCKSLPASGPRGGNHVLFSTCISRT